ncbi:hypothetical protein ESCO_005092 [Escovopsis weberi]|uniref:Uncharacterized protein n=1 Tax=Escovopsis weberi TaxID=150374 RepID=A0A0M8N1W2_ESCWE|nr:hypothetical protein ESCO_005092 [Escovopsis weberi]
MGPVAPRLRAAFSFGKDPFDPSHRFVTSWLVSPWMLFILRAIIATYILFTHLFIIAWYCSHPAAGGCLASRQLFSYFTFLTYWGLFFYFAVAALHTLDYALASPEDCSPGAPTLLARLPRLLQALHALLYTTITTYPPLVTVVYWALLYSGSWFPDVFDAWYIVSVHAINLVFALFEILIPRTERPPLVHAVWIVVLLGGYLGVAYITAADQGFYVYKFLDHDAVGGRGVVAAYIVGIAVGAVVGFLLVSGAIVLRRRITEDRLGMLGKLKAHDGGSRGIEFRRLKSRYPQGAASREV